MTETFEEFMRLREDASNASIAGDPGPLRAMLTQTDPATFLPRTGRWSMARGRSRRQVARMEIRGQDGPVDLVLRTTEVFRLEDGGWKLVHRHADLAAPTGG